VDITMAAILREKINQSNNIISGIPVVFLAQVQAVFLCRVLGSPRVGIHWLLLHLNQTELAG